MQKIIKLKVNLIYLAYIYTTMIAHSDTYTKHEDKSAYQNRYEPPILKRLIIGKLMNHDLFESLKSCEDIKVLSEIEKLLTEKSEEIANPSLVPWIAPPFGKIIGYGLYSRTEAVKLSHQSYEEKWGIKVGFYPYDLERIRQLLIKVKSQHQQSA